jgi:hypothetical protein
LVRRNSRSHFAQMPAIKGSFSTESLAHGYHELFVEGQIASAIGYFRKSAIEATDPYDRSRALWGLVQSAAKANTRELSIGAMNTLAEYLRTVSPELRFNDPSIQLPLGLALKTFAEKLHDKRYQVGSDTFVDRQGCTVLSELFRSLGISRPYHAIPLLQIVEELERTAGARCTDTAIGLAELKGVLLSDIAPGDETIANRPVFGVRVSELPS